MITLQLLVNQECQITNLGPKAKRLNLQATTRMLACTCTRLHKKISVFTLSRDSVMSVHRNYLIGEKIKFLAGFELAFSIILLEVLGLIHYTTAEDIVILLPL